MIRFPSLVFILLGSATAQLNVSNVFGSHMVLQHDVPCPIFGTDAPGTVVTVAINGGSSYVATTAGNGSWVVVLAAHGYGGPHELDISSTSGSAVVTFTDVFFGFTIVCGGQSNMQLSLSAIFNASAEIADASNRPLIRLFTTGQDGPFYNDAPLTYLRRVEQPWTVASPAAVGTGDFGVHSALCYLFARGLQDALASTMPGLPVGAISANWGGTCLASWLPADSDALRLCGTRSTSGVANLWNGIIAPFTVGPMAIGGFLFSQGECDADMQDNQAQYACAFPRAINEWRSRFAVPDAFFSFQQLPAYVNDSGRFSAASLPFFRNAQLAGLTAGGAVHATITTDLGDALAPHGSVHPRAKQPVAARMVAAALALVFGAPVPYESPVYARADAAVGVDELVVTVAFTRGSNDGGPLVLRPDACPVGIGGLPASECAWFEVQTIDGLWHNASRVSLSPGRSNAIELGVAGRALGKANATRGAFAPWPVVVLFSASGLPVTPWWEAVTTSV